MPDGIGKEDGGLRGHGISVLDDGCCLPGKSAAYSSAMIIDRELLDSRTAKALDGFYRKKIFLYLRSAIQALLFCHKYINICKLF